MSAGHSEASFNHSCLKVPVMVSSNRSGTFSKYERTSSGNLTGIRKSPDKGNYPILYDNIQSVKSYLKFYESIPDYTELHHLSNEEFYSQLKSLKITQKRFCAESGVLNNYDDLLASTETFEREVNRSGKKDGTCCSVCGLDTDYCKTLNEEKLETEGTVPRKCNLSKVNVVSDNEMVSDLSEMKKNSDYEADRESSTLQVPEKNHKRTYSYHSRDGRESYLGQAYDKGSWGNGSLCECETPELCHGYSDLSFRINHYNRRINSGHCASAKEKTSTKTGTEGNSRSIPLTSRIPLYDKIMEEKEARRKFIHERYSQRLRSLVQPFSFTKKEEEEKSRLRMVRSNPELRSSKVPTVRFKAKPIPKNLFSDYAYERMREEEFYRALKRRVRAEEMLKSSSLPPSMALRERKYLSKSLDVIGDGKSPAKSWENGYGYERVCRDIRRDVETDEKNKCSRKQKSQGWMSNKSRRQRSATDSSTEASPYQSVLSDVRRHSRPHSGKRLEKEMEDKLRESRLKNEARFKARIVRMAPDWKALNYDKEQDLALRLAVRRKENRVRQEKHEKLMESIYGRVYSMPPMFNSERFSKTAKKKMTKTKRSNAGFDDVMKGEPENESGCLPKTCKTGNGSFNSFAFFHVDERHESPDENRGNDDARRRENEKNEFLEDRKSFAASPLR